MGLGEDCKKEKENTKATTRLRRVFSVFNKYINAKSSQKTITAANHVVNSANNHVAKREKFIV